jgi:5-methylcytosine-specific restriction endonuclease McrA
MRLDRGRLKDLLSKTNSRCHVCRRTLVLKNYGVPGARGAWSVDHSRAQAIGGSHHFNNLWPACPPCNSSKGTLSSRTARAREGFSRAPFSKAQAEEKRAKNTIVGAGLLGIAGAILGAPIAVLAIAGGTLGYLLEVE